jgi:hypothetical protein
LGSRNWNYRGGINFIKEIPYFPPSSVVAVDSAYSDVQTVTSGHDLCLNKEELIDWLST